MANVASKFTWVIPTTSADGTPLVANEISGYNIGIRAATGTTAGTYATVIYVDGAASASDTVALSVAPGNYIGAVQATGPNGNSAWSAEAAFTVVAAPPVPAAPTGFSAS